MPDQEPELVKVELEMEDGRIYRTQLPADDPRVTDETKAKTKVRAPESKGDVKTK
jgi:hypothetical protein